MLSVDFFTYLTQKGFRVLPLDASKGVSFITKTIGRCPLMHRILKICIPEPVQIIGRHKGHEDSKTQQLPNN
jgi:hypothetical protein